MKRISLGILIFLIAITANAQSKIGTIDAEYILSQMPENTQVSQGMEAYNKELQSSIQTTIAKYEERVKDYQATAEGLAEDARTAKEDTIIQLENEIKNFRQKASVMMQVKRNELTAPLYEKIDTAMKAVIAEESYTQIFHAGASGLAFSRAEDDITLKVMKKMGIKPQEPKPEVENTVEN